MASVSIQTHLGSGRRASDEVCEGWSTDENRGYKRAEPSKQIILFLIDEFFFHPVLSEFFFSTKYILFLFYYFLVCLPICPVFGWNKDYYYYYIIWNVCKNMLIRRRKKYSKIKISDFSWNLFILKIYFFLWSSETYGKKFHRIWRKKIIVATYCRN